MKLSLDANLKTLADVPRAHAASKGDQIATSFEGRLTTHAEFNRHASQIANALIAAGLKPGDRVAHVGKNTDSYFELIFGCMKAGVIIVPVVWRLAPPEVSYIVQDSGAKLLFIGPEFIDLGRQVAAECPGLQGVIAMEGGAPEWPDFVKWRDAQPDIDPRLECGSDEPFLQLYTSGTTGRPKGAMLTHNNFLAMRRLQDAADEDWLHWYADDIGLVAMPNGHIGGTGFGIWVMYYGVKAIITREFDPMQVLDMIEHEGVNKFFMVPAALQFVVRQPRARQIDYSRLRSISYGASPIPHALLVECMDVFKCGFVQMYGLTETTGTVVALPPEDHAMEETPRMRSAGRALPGVEIAILDDNGKPLPPGEIGEIAIRSPSNMIGYYNLPEATAAAMPGDGWFKSGDAGYMDEDGYLYVHDRMKDMIISGGENIYPAEVENALCSHPAVAEAAVIGIPSQKWGEEVKAIVALRPDKEVTEEDLIGFVRTRIAAFKAPKSVDFIELLPRNASGKILRRTLREPYWAGYTRQIN
ncbi:fatty acid--CoA ligase [Camelimonas lactis]|uniref:3-methylmercaptopropionyl-CoA ligase n=1 Tax=Camelimonas lactis TaxID=659006 RepID=A0A4R2GU82_9HYPH|nr:fatty acid--CoA ligase [Camelimonas lactis]TCO13428.1 acyl-CoA synthetase (AMP-forming)/AMP-acid ligase II [Camelimonas lactis]